MAKSLRVPQHKDGLTVDVRTLLQNVQRAFLEEVESFQETGSNFVSPAASSSGGDSPFVRGGGDSQPAASSSGGDSLVVRQILQDILELGRLP